MVLEHLLKVLLELVKEVGRRESPSTPQPIGKEFIFTQSFFTSFDFDSSRSVPSLLKKRDEFREDRSFRLTQLVCSFVILVEETSVGKSGYVVVDEFRVYPVRYSFFAPDFSGAALAFSFWFHFPRALSALGFPETFLQTCRANQPSTSNVAFPLSRATRIDSFRAG